MIFFNVIEHLLYINNIFLYIFAKSIIYIILSF